MDHLPDSCPVVATRPLTRALAGDAMP